MVEVRERTNHSFTGEKTPEQTDIQDAIQAGTPLRGVLPLFNPDSAVGNLQLPFPGSYRIYGSRIWNPLQIWWKGTRPQNICQGEPHRRPLAK